MLTLLSIKTPNTYSTLSIHGSHKVVIESLLRGLANLHVPFTFNNWNNLTDIVYINSDINKLKHAIKLKREGRIKKLVAGPNLVVRPIDDGGLVGSKEIDLYLVNSDWTLASYIEDMPKLESKIAIWYAGVDPQYWNPPKKVITKNVLIYCKTESNEFHKNIGDITEKAGYIPIYIKYGRYKHDEYKAKLSNCCCAIFISRSESQGIALSEAWAMNIPTLVWNPKELNAHGKIYKTVSACPYLTEETGREWKTLEELKVLLSQYNKSEYHPRNWVLSHMTDEKSAECFLNIMKRINI